MMHAYDETYLPGAQRLLANMLDYLVMDQGHSIELAWQYFLSSDLCPRFECGDCAVLAGVSGIELAYGVLQQSGKTIPTDTPTPSYDRSPVYWSGWALAWYQWESGLRFREIERAVPIGDVRSLYDPYHEMDIRQFADRMNELYLAATPDTNLKTIRMAADLSQSALARRADVPVRTIQQYEQRQKNINKAQAQTLLQLSRALHCDMEDLMERVTAECAQRGSFLTELSTPIGMVAENATEYHA